MDAIKGDDIMKGICGKTNLECDLKCHCAFCAIRRNSSGSSKWDICYQIYEERPRCFPRHQRDTLITVSMNCLYFKSKGEPGEWDKLYEMCQNDLTQFSWLDSVKTNLYAYKGYQAWLKDNCKEECEETAQEYGERR